MANATPGTGALANIYTVDNIASPISGSVVTTDSTGTFNFYAPDGRYDFVVSVTGISKTVADVEVSDITETQSGDVPAVFSTLNYTTALQHSGTAIAATDLSNGTTGTTSIVLANTPTLVSPILGAATATSIALGGGTALTTTNRTGTGNLVLATSPTLATPVLGAATATSINGVTVPSTSDTVALLAAAQTLSTTRLSPRAVSVATATSITPNSDTSDIVTQVNTQTAGTLTLNAPTGTPTDGQKLTVRIKSTNAQTYSFNATYHFSTTVTAPTTLAATKTDYIGCMWNATNSVWDVVAVDQGHS